MGANIRAYGGRILLDFQSCGIKKILWWVFGVFFGSKELFLS
jgi:hypothetical protein